jgi:hypothetical protein
VAKPVDGGAGIEKTVFITVPVTVTENEIRTTTTTQRVTTTVSPTGLIAF